MRARTATAPLPTPIHLSSPPQVLDAVATSVHMFDEVNVATALHRLAKLQPPAGGPGGGPAALFASDPFARLVAAAGALLPRFGAQAVSNTLWAFATLGYLPEDDLLDRVALHAAATMATFRPQATSNTLWAMAKLGYAPPEELFVAAAAQIEADMGCSVPQDISNSLWAFATLRHHPGTGLLAAAASRAVATAPRFKPQEVANTLWAFATLGHDPGAPALDALAAQAASRVHAFRPQAISNSLWAFARLGYSPGHAALDAVAAHVGASLHQFTAQELANTLWALAALEFYPGAGLLDAAAGAAAARLDQFAPQDATHAVTAFARLFHSPPGGPLRRAADHVDRAWARYRVGELAGMAWALALLRGLPSPLWHRLLSRLADVAVETFDDADVLQLYGAFLMLGGRPARGVRAGAAAASFPAALADRGARVWAASARRPPPGRFVGELAAALAAAGVPHAVGGTTPCGLFAADVLLLAADGVTLIALLDADAPPAFASGSRRPLGRTASRRAAAEACGYALRAVPYFEWDAMAGDPGGRGEYLVRLVASLPAGVEGADAADAAEADSAPPDDPADGLAAAVAGLAVDGPDDGAP